MFSIGHSNDEQRLVKRLRNGENGAMQEFYSRYANHLTAICSRYVTDSDDLKDVFQDALIHIFTHIGDFEYRGTGSLKAWASRIVVNEALDYLNAPRHRKTTLREAEVTVEPFEEEVPSFSDIPPDVIQQMIKSLPTGYRTVFNLYVFENKSHGEIARLLGIKECSSSSQFSRARSLLARMVREYYNKEQLSR